MRPETSLYLDVVRFFAATTVFLGHASGQLLGGGLFWQLGSYLQTAVMVFFVLSGYVIAHVVETRERNWRDYAASRLSRLYSVCIPALLLTMFLDSIGASVAPSLYFHEFGWFLHEDLGLRYLASLLFLHQIWGIDLSPGMNGPYWSLGYEAFYYAIFAAMFFARGKLGYIVAILLCLLAGPSIVFLFPLWLLGYAIYVGRDSLQLSERYSWILFVSSLSVLWSSPSLRQALDGVSIPLVHRASPLGDYVDGLATGAHLLALGGISFRMSGILVRFSTIIRWAGSLTFALYLFHRPLVQFFSAIGPEDKATFGSRIMVFGGTFIVVAFLGRWCEEQKRPLRRIVLKAMSPASRSTVA